MFERNLGGADNWGERTKVTGTIFREDFGSAVALLGDTALIGTGTVHSDFNAYFLERNRGGIDNWGVAKMITGSLYFGSTVSLTADTAIIGAYRVSNDGTAYIYYLENRLADGATCAVGADCASGFCVETFCCDTACGSGSTTDCQACSVAAGAPTDGTCAAIADSSS
ncbi:MAG: hypothetical protein V3T05_13525, partial [Myxococcota bacterium]